MSDALNAILKQGGKSALGDTTSPALSKMLGAKAPSAVAPKRATEENPLEVPVDPDSVGSIVGRTVDNLQASLAGTVAAVGEATGSEYLKDWGEAEVQAQQEEASQYGAPSISSYTQVDNLNENASAPSGINEGRSDLEFTTSPSEVTNKVTNDTGDTIVTSTDIVQMDNNAKVEHSMLEMHTTTMKALIPTMVS